MGLTAIRRPVLLCLATLLFAFALPAQTTGESLLTTDNAYNPIPSPNGKYVAYVRTGWGRGMVTGFGRTSLISDVTLIDSDGTLKPRILAESFFLSGWTPDSKHVVCYRDGSYTLVSKTGQQIVKGRITEGSEWVAYLPSRATLVWDDAGTIRTPAGFVVRTGLPDERVVPSPDGRYLAVFSAVCGSLRVFDVRLKSWTNLGPIDISPDNNWSYIQPYWNPWFRDSSRLAFLRGSTLVLAKPDGTGKTQIRISGRAGLPAVSPDGKSIAFVTFEPHPMRSRPDLQFWGGTTIWVVPASGESAARALTAKNPDEVYDLKWLGNGTVVFDRVADWDFYQHARIWKAPVHP